VWSSPNPCGLTSSRSGKDALAPNLPSWMQDRNAVLADPKPVAVVSLQADGGLEHREPGERRDDFIILETSSGGDGTRRALDLDRRGEKERPARPERSRSWAGGGDGEGVMSTSKPIAPLLAAPWALKRRPKRGADIARDLQNAGAGEPARLDEELQLRGLGGDRRISNLLNARAAVAFAFLSSASAVS